jgi:hypothetical protein
MSADLDNRSTIFVCACWFFPISSTISPFMCDHVYHWRQHWRAVLTVRKSVCYREYKLNTSRWLLTSKIPPPKPRNILDQTSYCKLWTHFPQIHTLHDWLCIGIWLRCFAQGHIYVNPIYVTIFVLTHRRSEARLFLCYVTYTYGVFYYNAGQLIVLCTYCFRSWQPRALCRPSVGQRSLHLMSVMWSIYLLWRNTNIS